MDHPICIIDDCSNRARTKSADWCHKHYTRNRRHGSPHLGGPREHSTICTINECDREFYARGWCHAHYEQWRRTGNPIAQQPSLERRFWEKVDVRGPDDCWEWTAGLTSTGYGQFHGGELGAQAHRVSLALHLGRPLRDGLLACHHCDNPTCVNPRHLYEGTKSSNAVDAVVRGLWVNNPTSGEEHPNAKLTWDDVREMRRVHAENDMSHAELGMAFGVSKGAAGRIVRGESWIE